MRPYVRPLVVTFSAFGLACLFSYAAILLTEPAKEASDTPGTPLFGRTPNRHARLTLDAAKVMSEPDGTTAGLTEAEKKIRLRSGMSFCGEGLPTRSDTPDSEDLKHIEAFKKACNEAFGGDPRKLMALAEFYQNGIGTRKDETEATRIHWIGAEKGDAECQFVFGRELMEGVGVKKDAAAGIAWLRKAADQKLAAAEYLLHKTYAAGAEVPADLSESRKWLLRAAEHGHPDARADLAEEILHANAGTSSSSPSSSPTLSTPSSSSSSEGWHLPPGLAPLQSGIRPPKHPRIAPENKKPRRACIIFSLGNGYGSLGWLDVSAVRVGLDLPTN